MSDDEEEDELNAVIDALKNEVRELRELLLDCFIQDCHRGSGKYHHWNISAYEDAQEYLVRHLLIRKEDCEQ